MITRGVPVLVALALLACGGSTAAKRAGPYIAFTADFEGYRTWSTWDRGADPIPPSHRRQ